MLKFSDNGNFVIEQLRQLREIFSPANMTNILTQMGEELKRRVLDSSRWTSRYDLRDYNQFLTALESEVPTVRTAGYEVTLSYGNLSVLNEIKRPADVIKANIKHKKTGEVVERTIYLKAGDFPYWIVIEFGSLAKADSMIPLNLKNVVRPSKRVSKYHPYRLGDGVKSVSGKPAYIMVRGQRAKPYRGVTPSRPFRRAMTSLFEEGYIQTRIRQQIRDLTSKIPVGGVPPKWKPPPVRQSPLRKRKF